MKNIAIVIIFFVLIIVGVWLVTYLNSEVSPEQEVEIVDEDEDIVNNEEIEEDVENEEDVLDPIIDEERDSEVEESDEEEQSEDIEEEVVEFRVEVGEGSRFSVDEIRVNQGDRVRITFRNTGNMPHDMRIDGSSGQVGTSILQSGEEETFEFIAITAGNITYYCSLHRQDGMVGTLIIQ